jgi:hypothetical protein
VRQVVAVVVGASLALVAAIEAADAAHPEREAMTTKVLDKTIVCANDDGVVTVGSAQKTTNHRGGVAADDAVSMSAPGATADLTNFPFAAADTDQGAFVNTKRCKPTTIRVALTRKGLPGPPVVFGSAARCAVGTRLVLRLRYTHVPGPAPARYAVGGRLISAFLAVRTYRTSKPLAFARLTANGNTSQLYSASSCSR